MGAKMTEQSTATYLHLRAKTSETDPTPYFSKSEKINGNWETTQKFPAVDGHLCSIEHGEFEWEGQKKHKCKMKLADPDGSVTYVESNYNNLLYSILNSLASCNPELIDISVYLGKAKVDNGREGKRYPSAGVLNNGERIGWKYPYDQIPQPQIETYKGKKVTDDSNVIEFWTNVISEIAGKLKSPLVVPAKKSDKQPVTGQGSLPGVEGLDNEPTDDSGLPF